MKKIIVETIEPNNIDKEKAISEIVSWLMEFEEIGDIELEVGYRDREDNYYYKTKKLNISYY